MKLVPKNIFPDLDSGKFLPLVIFTAFLFRFAYGLCVNFAETNTLYLQDYTQIYLIGLKFYTSGVWPYWGPDITYTASQIPGALMGLLVGLPFYLLELPESPFLFLNIISTLSLIFFGWYISCRFPAIPRWFIYTWILTAPWTMNFSTTVINPSYLLAPSIFFFIAVIEMMPVYEDKIFSTGLACFIMGFTLGWIIQIHLSWVLLPFFILPAFYFLAKKSSFRTVMKGLLFFIAGFVLIMVTLLPTILRFGFVSGNAGSAIQFNPSNFVSLDIFTRFLAFSTFDARQFITGGSAGEKILISNNPLSAPVIVGLYITGILQVIYYSTFFFRRSNLPGFAYIKRLAVLSILITYFSYLFTIRQVASYTFYLLLPVSFLFSFYCLEFLLKKKFWKRFAFIFILAGILYHITLAREYFSSNSLWSKRERISDALKEKDSRLFAIRRTARWEIAERDKYWVRIPETGSNDTVLTFLNGFDSYPREILPESLDKTVFVSSPYSCRVDSARQISIGLVRPLGNIPLKQSAAISFQLKFSELNEGLLAVSIHNPDTTLFWSAEKICRDSSVANQWRFCSIVKELPVIGDPDAILSVYIWQPDPATSSRVWVDNMKVEFR